MECNTHYCIILHSSSPQVYCSDLPCTLAGHQSSINWRKLVLDCWPSMNFYRQTNAQSRQSRGCCEPVIIHYIALYFRGWQGSTRQKGLRVRLWLSWFLNASKSRARTESQVKISERVIHLISKLLQSSELGLACFNTHYWYLASHNMELIIETTAETIWWEAFGRHVIICWALLQSREKKCIVSSRTVSQFHYNAARACMYCMYCIHCSHLYITNPGSVSHFAKTWVSLQTTTYISKSTKYFDILLLLTCEEVLHAPIVQI